MTEKRDVTALPPHEEGEPERITEPDEPLSDETKAALAEHGITFPKWKPEKNVTARGFNYDRGRDEDDPGRSDQRGADREGDAGSVLASGRQSSSGMAPTPDLASSRDHLALKPFGSAYVIDVTLADGDGVHCFVPVEFDEHGEVETIVIGMNYLTSLDGGPRPIVGIIHSDGDEAVEAWCDANH